MKIDAHHHFWNYTSDEYGWIDDEMASLRRDFMPDNLAPEIRNAGVDGVISVQARQTLEETKWLLSLAGRVDFVLGVVGWVPLVQKNVKELLGPLAESRALRAVRHVLQSEADDAYMLRGDFNRGIGALGDFGLVYDILIFERHLPNTIEFVDRHPNQTFVLDHIAKPRIKEKLLSPWRENIAELAKRPNVHCKLSGMVTEADFKTWTEADLAPYFDVVLQSFGPQRLLFGSDWPVCLAATTYGAWFDLVSRKISTLSSPERDAILGGNAIQVYGLNPK